MESNNQHWIEQNRQYLLEQSKMLQSIIARMDNHCLEIKKFAGTIWSALMGFGFSTHQSSLFGLALMIIIFFGFLDVYYLSLEQRFRDKFSQLMEILGKSEAEIGDNLELIPRNFVKLERLYISQFWGLYFKKMRSIANLPYLVLLVATVWIWKMN